MARGGHQVLRLSPTPWLGLTVDRSEKFNEAMKGLVGSMRAWDRSTFTWWVPREFLPHVVTLIREHRVATDAELDRARAEIDLRERPAAGTLNATIGVELTAQLYATLGLHPSAPPMLVEWALAYWRREASLIGAPTTKLLQVEEAYRQIVAAHVAAQGQGRG